MSVVRRAITIGLFAACALLAIWYFMHTQYIRPLPVTSNATLYKPRKQLQAFNLIDADGNKFDLNSLRGHWTLVFFGYTSCPDICPETLAIMRDTWQLYKAPAKPPVKFIFASITPLTPDNNLKEFLANYNSEFTGIGGSDGAIKQLGDQLGVYAHQESWKIDHTSALMLLDPQARLAAVLTPPFSPEILAQDLNLITSK